MLEFDQNDDYFDTEKRDLGGKKSDNTKEKRERQKKGSQLICIPAHDCNLNYCAEKKEALEMEDEEFVSPHKARHADKSKEKDEDLESEQSLSDTSDADEVSYRN